MHQGVSRVLISIQLEAAWEESLILSGNAVEEGVKVVESSELMKQVRPDMLER